MLGTSKTVRNPPFLWHGSAKKIEGELILPKQGRDSRGTPENNQLGVYATRNRDVAITMALKRSKGVGSGHVSYGGRPPYGIFEELPTQERVYLYKLPSETFEPAGRGQWISFQPVKPIKEEEVLVKDVMHLVRKATEEEKASFHNKPLIKQKI